MTVNWSAGLGAYCALLLGCGAGAPNVPHAESGNDLVEWVGRVQFEARAATPRGASEDTEIRPARWVTVQALGSSGAIVASGLTDWEGNFVLTAPRTATQVVALSAIDKAGHRLSVSPDPLGRRAYGARRPLASPSEPIEVLVQDAPGDSAAAAFQILDTVLRGAEAVHAWTGKTLPPLFVYWGRGVTTGWSYYRGERGAGRYALELLAGLHADVDHGDADEYDEAIILHEFGHFVFDHYGTDSSAGGDHPAGYLIDPGLAWEEGRATWFSSAVRSDPVYADVVGRAPYGRMRVRIDIEHEACDLARADEEQGYAKPRGPGPVCEVREPRGPGSEREVAEILWDLSDGVPSIPDADDDGVALGPAALLRAMFELRDVPGAYPDIAAMLDYLVRSGASDSAAVKRVLEHGGHPVERFLSDSWLTDIGIPSTTQGKIDGLSQPAPSGGPNRAQNGIDALDVFRFNVASPAWISAELTIMGRGTAADRTDLDIELRSIRGKLIEGIREAGPSHTISRLLEPGWYVIYVRDGGHGNRAAYELRLRPGAIGPKPASSDLPSTPTESRPFGGPGSKRSI